MGDFVFPLNPVWMVRDGTNGWSELFEKMLANDHIRERIGCWFDEETVARIRELSRKVSERSKESGQLLKKKNRRRVTVANAMPDFGSFDEGPSASELLQLSSIVTFMRDEAIIEEEEEEEEETPDAVGEDNDNSCELSRIMALALIRKKDSILMRKKKEEEEEHLDAVGKVHVVSSQLSKIEAHMYQRGSNLMHSIDNQSVMEEDDLNAIRQDSDDSWIPTA